MEANDQREISIWYAQALNIKEKHEEINEILLNQNFRNGKLIYLAHLINRCNCDYQTLSMLELKSDNPQDIHDINHKATEINKLIREFDLPSALKLI